MPIMTYRNDDERGETFIRSADFVENADDALRAIYHGNAARLIPGVQERLERAAGG